ncbi:unnamed protein product [Rhodiola kirilowii]
MKNVGGSETSLSRSTGSQGQSSLSPVDRLEGKLSFYAQISAESIKGKEGFWTKCGGFWGKEHWKRGSYKVIQHHPTKEK